MKLPGEDSFAGRLSWIGGAVLLAIGMCWFLTSGDDPILKSSSRPPLCAKFHAGQMVKVKLDGRVGQIIRVGDFCAPVTYDVRFETKGVAIRPQTLGPRVCPGDVLYVTVWDMNEFEIEPAK